MSWRPLLLLSGALLLVGCQREKAPPAATKASATAPAGPTAQATQELVVLAAASLKAAFETMEETFEAQQRGVDVRFAFAGTQELRRQLESGARADVFASADEAHMQALFEQHLVDTPIVFTENVPVIVTFAGSKTAVTTFREFPKASRVVLGVPEVPIGRYSLKILDRAEQAFGSDFRDRVEARIASRELNVRQVLAKVALGEADAAIVYRSDVSPPQRSVRVVEIPEEVNVIARYPIAVVTASKHASVARSWLAFVRSAAGHAALSSAGFQPVLGS